jgi:hypothetical protein
LEPSGPVQAYIWIAVPFMELCLTEGCWIRDCATNQKFTGLIPGGVSEFFIDTNPSDRTMALGTTQPLTEMSTGSISWG